MKITIIMPTYNDCDSIEETLSSVLEQDYDNWELLISDDGSTDGTKDFIKRYIDERNEKRIKYFYQENQDQLNAILNVLNYITGDIVYILHSDDLFYDSHVLSKAVEYFDTHECESIISSPYCIDKDSNITGRLKVGNYKISDSTMALQLLWLGRNLFIDFAFHKKETFVTKVKENYLIWNTPFWLITEPYPNMLKVDNVDFPFFKYRIFEGNYINNEIGKLNVINGELRTATRLMKFYNLPFYKIQYMLFRIFNKFNFSYKPIFSKKETSRKFEVLKFIIEKRYSKDEYKRNLFLNNLLMFYKNENKRTICIDKVRSEDFIYYGKDMRRFNKDLLSNNLSGIYLKILQEMENGFDTIVVNNKNDYEKMIVVIKFLCIFPYVNVVIKNK